MHPKPHITKRSGPSRIWPGAMDFKVDMPNGCTYYLTVDTWEKLAKYMSHWLRDHGYPAGVDLG